MQGAEKSLAKTEADPAATDQSTALDILTKSAEEAYTHGDAQEFLIVQAGRVTLWLGAPPGKPEQHELGAGDSIEYRTSTPHRIAADAAAGAEVLWVISPPTSV